MTETQEEYDLSYIQ